MTQPLHELSVVALAEAVRAGKLRAMDVVEHHLERIGSRDAPLGSFVFLDPEGARRSARAVDAAIARGEDPGPLAGVPFGVKELEDVEGWPHPRGARVLADQVATTTSTQVQRLRAAGAVALGLTASPEVGMGSWTASLLHGVCRNPWRTDLTPGGSSGGSGAAVCAGLVPFATGSDSGGSLRIPAAYCGLVGFKGTYGRVPRGPRYVGLPNVRNYGVLTRDVRDTTRLLDCVVGSDERDPLSLPHPGFSFEAGVEQVELARARVAWSDDLGFGVCDPTLARVVRDAAEALIASARLDEREVAVRLPDPEEAWRVLGSPDLRSLYAPFLPQRAEDVSPFVRVAFEASKALGVDDFGRAALLRDALVQALADLFDAIDLLLLPTVSVPAFAAEGPMPTTIAGRPVSPLTTAAQTYVFNLSGHPAVSIPAGLCEGAPVGLQIVGRRHDDLHVLAAAAAFERARPWPRLAPA